MIRITQIACIDLILDTLIESKDLSWDRLFSWNDVKGWLETEKLYSQQYLTRKARNSALDEEFYHSLIELGLFETPRVSSKDVG